MRFTRRRGGPMVTLHTRHDVLPYHVTTVLCAYGDRLPPGIGPDDGDDDGGLPGGAAVEKLVREILAEYGRTYLTEDRWDTEWDDEAARARAQWAIRQMRRLYPVAVAEDSQFAAFAAEFEA